jgi:lipoprotein-releasing system permease protein
MASLEAWLPGAIAPSVQTRGILRYASRDVSVNITGIDPQREPRVSQLATQIRQGSLTSLYRTNNAMILGDRLAEKIGARVGSNITVQTSAGRRLNAQVVGLSHTGIRSVDEATAYVLLKTGQIIEQQTGLVNEIRIRVRNPMQAREVAARVEEETGYKSVSWQEAHEDLLSSFVIRNIIMYTVVGAILLVASFGTYNIISTITHEKARDIAIMKSLGLSEATVRTIFVLEGQILGIVGGLSASGSATCCASALGSIEIKSPFVDATGFRSPTAPGTMRLRSASHVLVVCGRLLYRRAGPRECTRSTSSGARHD